MYTIQIINNLTKSVDRFHVFFSGEAEGEPGAEGKDKSILVSNVAVKGSHYSKASGLSKIGFKGLFQISDKCTYLYKITFENIAMGMWLTWNIYDFNQFI
jgi:hypothetical protein